MFLKLGRREQYFDTFDFVKGASLGTLNVGVHVQRTAVTIINYGYWPSIVIMTVITSKYSWVGGAKSIHH
jgi:hypothetical protein